MKKLIYYEFKKLWNKTSLLAISALVLFLIIMSGLYYGYYENPIITSNGDKIIGPFSHYALKEQSHTLEGKVDQKYLDDITSEFDSSVEKEKFSDRFGIDMMRFNIASYLLNFPSDLSKTSNFSMRFDYKYLKSEKDFYEQYKKGVKSIIRTSQKNIKEQKQSKWFQYTEDQLEQIDNKIDSLKPQFKITYYLGLEKVIMDFSKQFWILLIVLSFGLSGIFSKDSSNGIEELSLASKNGRNKNMNAKIISGNLFSIIIYLIFITIILILNGIFASLHGLDGSVQLMWRTSLYNMSLGTAMLIMFFMGLLGTLIIANFIMLISMITKYVKLSTICSISSVLILVKLTKTLNMLQLQLNPLHFSTVLQLDKPIFIGDLMLPNVIVSALIGIVYLTIIVAVTKTQYKKYALRGGS